MIAHVNSGDRPLALYVFTNDKKTGEKVYDEAISGGVTVNDVMLHGAVDSAP